MWVGPYEGKVISLEDIKKIKDTSLVWEVCTILIMYIVYCILSLLSLNIDGSAWILIISSKTIIN